MTTGLAALQVLAKHAEQNKIARHIPYGHPDTLCPDGKVWKEKFEAGEWQKWSNKPWQWDFYAAGKDAMQRMLISANRVGKCTTYQTLISTPSGEIPIGELYEKGEPFDVFAWDGEKVVTTRALPPFKKPGLHDCYRLTTRRGWVECADDHRLLLDGVWQHARFLPGCVVSRQRSSSVFSPLVRGEDGLRWWERLQGFLVDYRPVFRFGGEPLQLEANTARVFSPLPDDVQKRISALSYGGDLGQRYTNTLQPSYVPLASSDGPLPLSAQCVDWLARAFYSTWKRCLGTFLEFHLFSNEEVSGPRSDRAATVQSWLGGLLKNVPQDVLLSANDIVSYDFIGLQEVYDFTVPVYANYLAGGLVNHNTYTEADEVSYHMTGEYPDWWVGRRFDCATNGWTGSPTNETSRDIVQKELLGHPDEKGEYGTGTIPKRLITKVKTRQAGIGDVVDYIQVKHVSGKLSRCVFKTYEQGWQKWQGTEQHWVWLDEEPDDIKIYTEALTRLATTGGVLTVTYTPIKGRTELLLIFEKNPKAIIIRATWDDAPHLTEKVKDELKAGYPGWELETRTMGVPMMGEGRVFQFSEADIKEDPIEIPFHWPQIHGIDYGLNHPFGGFRWAWDRDNDVVHGIWCYRKRDAIPPIHAAALNGTRNQTQWIPVAGPHDGLNRDKGKGITLAKMYIDAGVNMLPLTARYNDNIGGGQGEEQIIMEVIDRAETGRLKISSICHEWWEEFRNYHRKDGILVRRGEDVLKASFYGLMMLRYARIHQVLQTNKSPYTRPMF